MYIMHYWIYIHFMNSHITLSLDDINMFDNEVHMKSALNGTAVCT